MQCPTCGTEVQIQQGFCPRCATFIGMPGEVPPQGKKPRLWPLLFGMLLFVLLVTVIPAWLLWKYGLFRQRPQVLSGPVLLTRQRHVPAELSELHGEGEIYFVPLGKQVVAPESLIQHYKSKFNLTIHLLPPLPLATKAFDRERRQYIAEELVEQIKRAYPGIAKDPKAVMIGLTNEDIYVRNLTPREFNYTYRREEHFGIVSTHRMDNIFWGDPPQPGLTERRAQQMVTKDIAVLYYKLPLSVDPESVLFRTIDPDGRPDDIWESDVHPEDSDSGLNGFEFCVAFTYSYQTGNVTLYPDGRECNLPDERDTNLEVFRISPKYGDLSVYKTDFGIPGRPPITFQHVYLPRDKASWAFGTGGRHSYDRYLTTDNTAVMDEVDLVYPNSGRIHFTRTTPGRGSMPGMTFVGEDQGGDYHLARLRKESDHFSLKLLNGESYDYLPCDGKTGCINFESGYKDADGNELKYTRGAGQFLTAIASQDGSLSLSYDQKLRVREIQDQAGHHVSYEYNDAGHLSKVTANDAVVTSYEYGNNGRSLNVSVTGNGHPKTTIFSAEFDDASRILKAMLPKQGAYTWQYEFSGNEVKSVLMTSPEGKKLRIEYDGDSYVARSVR